MLRLSTDPHVCECGCTMFVRDTLAGNSFPMQLIPLRAHFAGEYSCTKCRTVYMYAPGTLFSKGARNDFDIPVAIEFEAVHGLDMGMTVINPWLETATDRELSVLLEVVSVGVIDVPSSIYKSLVRHMAQAAPSFDEFVERCVLVKSDYSIRIDASGFREWIAANRPYIEPMLEKEGACHVA